MRFGWNCWLLGLGLLLVSTPVRGENALTPQPSLSLGERESENHGQALEPTSEDFFSQKAEGSENLKKHALQETTPECFFSPEQKGSENFKATEVPFSLDGRGVRACFQSLFLTNHRGPENTEEGIVNGEIERVFDFYGGLKTDPRGEGDNRVSQAETTPQPQTTPQPATQELDLSPEIIENSPVLQRWLREVPNVLDEIRNDPSFRTRLRLGYSHFPSTNGASGFNVGVEDVFLSRTGLTVSGDYQRSFNGKRESFGADLRYYVLPLGSYFNIAPQVGYRNLTTGNYSTDGVNVGARLMLALSRTGAADIALTQSFVSPGSGDEVGMTTLSFGYAVTRNLRLSTDIQKQNSREDKDSRVGIVLEWMP